MTIRYYFTSDESKKLLRSIAIDAFNNHPIRRIETGRTRYFRLDGFVRKLEQAIIDQRIRDKGCRPNHQNVPNGGPATAT